jgi:hypothetical protein
MGAISAMNDTFRFIQKRFTDLAMPAVEGYLIMMVMQVIMVPLMIIMMFPALLIPYTGGGGIFIIILIMIIIYVIAFIVGSMGMGITLGGTVRVVDAIRNYEKPKFGDVFKYGWRNKWELFTIHLLNYLAILLIFSVILGIFFGIGILVFYTNPLAGLFFMIFGFMLIPFSLYFLMPLMYLPFVVRHKRGVRGTECIGMAWREFFSEPFTYGGIGFLYMLLVILLSMIPVLNILVALAMHVSFFSTLLIYYDEKYNIPVMPEPIKYPPYGGYSDYGYPGYPPYPGQEKYTAYEQY